MTDTVAYEQGRAAFLDGYADDVNPYHYRTQAHEDWLAGWDTAAVEAEHEAADDARDRALDEKLLAS